MSQRDSYALLGVRHQALEVEWLGPEWGSCSSLLC
jgi:hypothetical protein